MDHRRKASTAGCSPCPRPPWSAAAIALTGTTGILIVIAALLTGAGAIYVIAKCSPVTGENVNDSADVTINPEPANVSA